MLSPVYTIQPVVKPVVLSNRIDNRLYHVNGVLQSRIANTAYITARNAVDQDEFGAEKKRRRKPYIRR